MIVENDDATRDYCVVAIDDNEQRAIERARDYRANETFVVMCRDEMSSMFLDILTFCQSREFDTREIESRLHAIEQRAH